MTRHQFQVGPTRYVVVPGDKGWYVEAQWWQMRTDGDEEDFSERVTGPLEFAEAEKKARLMDQAQTADDRRQ